MFQIMVLHLTILTTELNSVPQIFQAGDGENDDDG
jgi:hypothetical protein